MKIAFLTPEYPHSKFANPGGIGTSIMNLSHGLVNAGHKVTVLIYGQAKDELFEEEGIVFYCVKNIKIKGLSWFLTRKKLERIINKLYLERKIDLVEAPDWTGITSFIKPKCPVIIRQNGSDTYFCHLDGRSVKFANRYHEKRALKNADALIAVSQFTGELTNSLFGLQREFAVIPNAIDVDLFDELAENQSMTNEILYFGSLIRKKGLLELPHIFNILAERYPEAKLTLIGRDVADIVSGSPSTWKMMQALFSEKALKKVNYMGSVDYDSVKKHISRAAVCVFPSFAEALPVSWLEAMAMKKPVVASNIGWALEMIENGKDGFLVDPKDHLLYANKIGKLLDSSELRTTVGEYARIKVTEKFSVQSTLQRNIDFYKSILKDEL